MSENNLAILSVRRRIAKSKSELSLNIHARMRWVVYAQDRMAENGRTIVMYAEELRRLNRKLEVGRTSEGSCRISRKASKPTLPFVC